MVESKKELVDQIAKERIDKVLCNLISKDNYVIKIETKVVENPNKVDDFTCNVRAKEKLPEKLDSSIMYWRANRELNFYLRFKGEITNNFVYFREDRASTIGESDPKWDDDYRKFVIYDVNGDLLLEKDTFKEKSLIRSLDC